MKTAKKMRLSVDWTEDTWAPKISFARFATPVPRLSPLPLSPVNHRCYSPPASSLFSSRGARGFTLVEMLVVIGIIAILAGILLPTIAIAKRNAKKATARTEMANLIAAIASYESEYSRPPAAKDVENQINDQRPDFTYGTEKIPPPTGFILAGGKGKALSHVKNGGTYTYEADNSVIMNVILNRDYFPNVNSARNPRRIVTFKYNEGREGDPGLDPNGVFRDPWGHPYIITVDMNEDNRCRDGYYSPGANYEIPGQVVIWSLGEDGQVNPPEPSGQPPTKAGANRDNILSWQ